MRNLFKLMLFSVLLFSCISVKAQKRNADDVLGTWVTEENRSIVKILKKDDKYYGKIIWLKEPNDEEGNEKTDKENPVEKLRSRKLINLIIMRDFVFDGVKWDDGKIYDPKSGNTYSGILKMRTDDIIDLRGYIGISLIGRTSSWIRYKPKSED